MKQVMKKEEEEEEEGAVFSSASPFSGRHSVIFPSLHIPSQETDVCGLGAAPLRSRHACACAPFK